MATLTLLSSHYYCQVNFDTACNVASYTPRPLWGQKREPGINCLHMCGGSLPTFSHNPDITLNYAAILKCTVVLFHRYFYCEGDEYRLYEKTHLGTIRAI